MFILVLAFSSVMMIRPAFAQSIPKPYVPEFSLKLVAHPYDVAPTTAIDPYTGNNVTIRAGYRVQNRSIEVTIKNQPFASYTDSNGSYISLYYSVGSKGHYGSDWSYYPNSGKTYPASDSEFAVITFSIDGLYSYGETLGNIPNGSQIDFQVEALIGSYTDTIVPIYPGHALSPTTHVEVFSGETSGWSNTQTITVANSTITTPLLTPTLTPTPTLMSSPSPSLIPSPSIPEFPS